MSYVNCPHPECNKKFLSRTQAAIKRHVFYSNVHEELSKDEKEALYRSMIPYVDVSSIGRKDNVHLEKQLTDNLGIK